MKKNYNIMIVLLTVLFFLVIKQGAFAISGERLLVSPVNIPTALSSYGVYPNTLDMFANDLINSINKYSTFDVPDLNSSKALIQSYGLSKDYKEFLMSYRDNRVIDAETCNLIGKRLGVNKILLVSGGYDIQNLFLNRSDPNKFSEIFSSTLPFTRFFTKSLALAGIPLLGGHIYNSVNNDEPIKPYYRLNINIALVDADTGIVMWEKAYKQDIAASEFGNPVNSFGENEVLCERLKDFSDKISREISYSVFVTGKNAEYTQVKSSIVTPSVKIDDNTVVTTPRDGKMTKDGQSFSKSLENKRKESYKSWVKERAKY